MRSATPPSTHEVRRAGWRARLPRIDRYHAKRALLWPRTVTRRRRARDLDPYARSMLETQYYRPVMYRFMAAVAENPSLLHDAALDADSVVVDVGAYEGTWAESVARRYGATVHAFEPNPHVWEALAERCAGGPSVTLHRYGLGAAESHVPLALDGPGASLFAPRGRFGSTLVEVRDVATVLDELGITEIDLVKVNIEGAEYDLFDRLIETGWLSRIRQVSVQFHEWHPRAYARRRRVRRALRRSHDLSWDYPWVWEFWSRRPEGDSRGERAVATRRAPG